MAQKQGKTRPKKKGPAPRKQVEPQKRLNKQQIIAITIGILVIASMTLGLLFSALVS